MRIGTSENSAVAESIDGIRAEGSPWILLVVKYKTGSNEKTVKIVLSKEGPGVAYVDDVGLVPAEWMLKMLG